MQLNVALCILMLLIGLALYGASYFIKDDDNEKKQLKTKRSLKISKHKDILSRILETASIPFLIISILYVIDVKLAKDLLFLTLTLGSIILIVYYIKEEEKHLSN